MKSCSKKGNCKNPNGTQLELSEFNKDKSRKDGLKDICRYCSRAESKRIREKYPYRTKEIQKVAVQKRKEKNSLLPEPTGTKKCGNPECSHKDGSELPVSEFYKNAGSKSGLTSHCKACHLECVKQWVKNNPGKVTARFAKYRASKIKATPTWADFKAIIQVYDEREEISVIAKMVGCTETFHVDHIIPLQGKKVSGLHIAENLQIITASENTSKGNKFKPL